MPPQADSQARGKPKRKSKRKPRDQTFRKSDVVRAYRAAVDAGVPNPIVRIDTINRQITIASGAPRDDDQTRNEWDEVCDSSTTAASK